MDIDSYGSKQQWTAYRSRGSTFLLPRMDGRSRQSTPMFRTRTKSTPTFDILRSLDILNGSCDDDDRNNGESMNKKNGILQNIYSTGDSYNYINNNNNNNNNDPLSIVLPPLFERQRSASPRSVSGIGSTVFNTTNNNNHKSCRYNNNNNNGSHHCVVETSPRADFCDAMDLDKEEYYPEGYLNIDPLPLTTTASNDLRHLLREYIGPDAVQDILPKTKLTFYDDTQNRLNLIDDDDDDYDDDDDMGTIDKVDDEDGEDDIGGTATTSVSKEWGFPPAFVTTIENKQQPTEKGTVPRTDQRTDRKVISKKEDNNNKKKTKPNKGKPVSKTKVSIKQKKGGKTIPWSEIRKKIKIPSFLSASDKATMESESNGNPSGTTESSSGSYSNDTAATTTTTAGESAAASAADRGDKKLIEEHIWNKHYRKLRAFYDANGNSNVLRSDPDKQLSGWVKRQRNNLKEGRLTPSQIRRLNDLGFVWNRLEGAWYQKYNQLKAFERKHGRCDVPTKFNRSLAEWVQRQRREYASQQSSMTHTRITKLEALPTWNWLKRSLQKKQQQEKYGENDEDPDLILYLDKDDEEDEENEDDEDEDEEQDESEEVQDPDEILL